jgi:hypothetical protein
VNVESYQTVDECIAVRERLQDSVKNASVFVDTIPWTLAEQSAPLPDVIVSAVQRCAAKFDPTSTALKDWYLALQLLVIAGRTDDVNALVTRRLSEIADTAHHQRARVLDSLLRAYIQLSSPPRFGEMDVVIGQLSKLPARAETWVERILRDVLILRVTSQYQDSVRSRQAAERIILISNTLTDADRSTAAFTDTARTAIFGAYDHLDREAGLDSLRNGRSDGYFAMIRRNWTRATEEAPSAYPFPPGNRAATVLGQWYGADGKRMPPPVTRPTRGRVALVVFYNSGYYSNAGQTSASIAMLRRLHQRFPALEINIVADHPPGYFGPRVAMDSIAEAEIWNKWLHDFNAVPAAIAIEKPLLFRLPNPDRRWLVIRAANGRSYRGKIGVDKHMVHGESYLVDQDGMIVAWYYHHPREQEIEIAKRVEILLARSNTSVRK